MSGKLPLPDRLLAAAELQTDRIVAELLRDAAYEILRLQDTLKEGRQSG